ncbi:MAG: sigma-70 family RNA polymerase sigma factor [Actinobacteria bacterium]|nr:sigma-70 family RNA polymerase sigma factor [Actinomycetota bacterium]
MRLDDPADLAADDAWLADALSTYHRTRDQKLRNEIVERSLWLARRSARRFADRGEPFDDVVQVARVALVRAVDRFDPALGVPFGAFATPTIIGEIKRHFRDRTWRVHVPRRAKDLRPAVNAASHDLSRVLGRAPTPREVAVHLEIEEDLVLQVIEANNAYRTSPLDVVTEGPVRNGIEDQVEGVMDREVVRQVLDRLRPRERQIIEMRFFDEMTQAQIAEKIGTSQVHVGRLISSSLTLLRVHLGNDPSFGSPGCSSGSAT